MSNRRTRGEDAPEHVAVIDSSGNVFADLNIPCSDEDMLKVHISRSIAATIRKRELTQVEAAEIIGTDQAKVSAILRGRLSAFSVDRLIRYLILLGRDIDIRVSGIKNERGKITFVQAA